LICKVCNQPVLVLPGPRIVSREVEHTPNGTDKRKEFIFEGVPSKYGLCYYHHKKHLGRFKFNEFAEEFRIRGRKPNVPINSL
jgi:hypothetical protein